MTTKSELKRYAKPFFTPEMAIRGFSITPKGFAYMRRIGEIYHFVLPDFSSGNESMRWSISAWVPEFALQPYDLALLPDELNVLAGGRLGKTGPSSTLYELWPCKTPEECANSLRLLLNLLDEIGLPWLDKITTREELAKNVNPLSTTDRFGNKTVDKIFGHNLLYRDQVKPIGT